MSRIPISGLAARSHDEAAARYAAADKSDPFTLARCHAHMRNGVANYRKDAEPFLWQGSAKGKMERVTPEPDAHYNATEAQETRITAAGDDYPVTVYRNIVRP